jgi:hypothetical protein
MLGRAEVIELLLGRDIPMIDDRLDGELEAAFDEAAVEILP